jgi:hypothetical protein
MIPNTRLLRSISLLYSHYQMDSSREIPIALIDSLAGGF